ncbi:MAG: hypothetical protein KC547_19925 [Anaerolineae bacterium]|nr:hypothetical protein [Anaerolineae bacterium]
MKRHPIAIRLVALFMLLTLAQPVWSQEPEADEARSLVVQAAERLAEGYHYTLDLKLTQTFTTADNTASTAYNENYVSGEVTATGDYHIMLTATVAESPDSMTDLPPLELEQISVNGERYLNLQTVDTVYENVLPDVEAGWQSLDELLMAMDTSVEGVMITNLSNITLPHDFPLTDDLILSVTELEPETVDSIDMRVFAVEVDALQVLIAQTPVTPLERIRMVLESADFFAKSKLSLTYTLWIGVEDGRLYRGTSNGYTFLPYLTENEPGPPYDIELISSAEFTIAQHGLIGELDLPDAVVALVEP